MTDHTFFLPHTPVYEMLKRIAMERIECMLYIMVFRKSLAVSGLIRLMKLVKERGFEMLPL